MEIPYLPLVYSKYMNKQCRPKSDATKRGIWSGSTLFATQYFLDTLSGSPMALFKFKGKYGEQCSDSLHDKSSELHVRKLQYLP